jgi:DNA-binding CsgD family transcriptional regulator
MSDREREVWALMAEGLTNSQIADRLAISRRTVEPHTAAVARKLDAKGREDAIARHPSKAQRLSR